MPLFTQDKLTPRQASKLESWRNWEASMKLLRSIHKDIKQKVEANRVASDWIFREGKFNG